MFIKVGLWKKKLRHFSRIFIEFAPLVFINMNDIAKGERRRRKRERIGGLFDSRIGKERAKERERKRGEIKFEEKIYTRSLMNRSANFLYAK